MSEKVRKTEQLSCSDRYLVTMPYGIGDTVYLGLAVVDQILRNRPNARIDVLCNLVQAEILEDDPRINPIVVPKNLSFAPQKRTWYRMFLTTPTMRKIASQLRENEYKGVFPGNGAFGFLRSLHVPIMTPSIPEILREYRDVRHFYDAPASQEVRRIVNSFFGDVLPVPEITETTPLYLRESRYQEAVEFLKNIKGEQKDARILLVAPDTASDVTRPPSPLLSHSIITLLREHSDLKVCILPSYTDLRASSRLQQEIISEIPELANRITLLAQVPRLHLLTLTALADLSDVVLTGDTGVMQLSIADKRVVNNKEELLLNIARNKRNTVAIFGGTNPGLYGLPERMIVVGRGGRYQRRIRPGFFKEGYKPKGRDFFSHVHSSEIVEAVDEILSSK